MQEPANSSLSRPSAAPASACRSASGRTSRSRAAIPALAPAGCALCDWCAGRARGPDAAQIITAFSRPGELVVIPDARDSVLVAAAAATGRRVLGLAPGPRSGQRVLAGLAGLDPRLRPLAEVRPGGPVLLLEAGNPEAGQAALAIAGGGEPAPGEPAADPGVLYAACQRVLRPGGVLAVITASTPRPGGLRDDPGKVISRARAAGLVYAQHIVALHVPVTGSQIAPAPGDVARPGGSACPRPQRLPRRHPAWDSREFSRTEGFSAGTRGSDALIAVGASVGSGPRRGMDLARPCQEAGRTLLTGGDSLVNMSAAGCPAPAAARSRARRPTWRVAMGIYPVTAIEPGPWLSPGVSIRWALAACV